jgi:uncharacterized membrane protein SirB2
MFGCQNCTTNVRSAMYSCSGFGMIVMNEQMVFQTLQDKLVLLACYILFTAQSIDSSLGALGNRVEAY